MTKMTITTHTTGRVTLSYDSTDIVGQPKRVERTFSAPLDRGYVRELRNGEWKQVCQSLDSMGNTLMADRASLPDVIRREYRAMRRDEKRDAARFA